MPVDVFDRSQLRDTDLHYVLTLTYGSRVLHFSTSPLYVTKADSTVIQLRDGLTPVGWTREIALGSSSPPLASVPVQVLSSDVDWSLLRSSGWDPAAATAELAQWRSGTIWELRRVLVSGLVIEPQYGAKGEPLQFSLKAHPFTDRAMLPEATAIVDSTTWPNFGANDEGRSYPLVFGYPGRGDGGSTRFPGSPGLLVDTQVGNRYLLIAGHRVDATTVDVLDEANLPSGTWVSLSVTHRQDGSGRTVATVTLEASGTGNAADFNVDSSYVVSWGNSTNGGGLKNRRETGPMRDAGDVLEYLLNRSTLKVDRGRTAAAVELLRGYKIDGYWDDPAGVWEWVKANLLPILPVYIQAGPDGLYPVVWRFDVLSAKESNVDVIDADRGDGTRVGFIKTASSLHGGLANEFRVAYALDDVGRKHRRVMTVHGDPDTASTAAFVPSIACRRSRSRYSPDTPSVMDIRSDLVYDASTAAAIGHHLALLHALPVRRVSYLCPKTYGHLRAGAPVKLTDTDVNFSNEPALIESIEDLGDDTIKIDLAILEGALLG